MTNHKHKTKTPTLPAPSHLVDEWPPPVMFLNYPGYWLGQRGQIRGPAYLPSLGKDSNDQLLTVVSESYDTVSHTTRHGLTYGIVQKRRAA